MTINLKKIFAIFALSSAIVYAPSALADDDWDDWDDDDYGPRRTQSYQTRHRAKTHTTYISRQRAAQIARSRIKGSSVRSIDFDSNDDGRGPVYDVELNSPSGRYDVKINARTGGVIYVRRDY